MVLLSLLGRYIYNFICTTSVEIVRKDVNFETLPVIKLHCNLYQVEVNGKRSRSTVGHSSRYLKTMLFFIFVKLYYQHLFNGSPANTTFSLR